MVIIYLGTLFFIFLIVILFFSSKKLSPVPYFPSNKKDLPLIIKSLKLKNNQIIIDLGAGDGIIIFAAAQEALKKKLNTKFIAIEINPVLLLIMYIKKIFHPNRKNIKIVYGDMFKLDFKKLLNFPAKRDHVPHDNFSLLTFYLYISPWFLEKVITNINSQLTVKNQQLTIVSYMYPIKSLKEKEKVIQGKNKIFFYQI